MIHAKPRTLIKTMRPIDFDSIDGSCTPLAKSAPCKFVRAAHGRSPADGRKVGYFRLSFDSHLIFHLIFSF